ncbi:uncharacterized protein K444DRAFT_46455 [Hyaloscypha bicolor E]|uniref:Uncharacterized protein n=1 Tax=Hyaloscypha bicolor E TaxID=1095630 RepID=A0A2J6T244_9HELO|nr:uncharacterized protein K444DRAFT_46455 [Hyaloscypha bicolor E]PMD57092.1 hypothetical protein K444DRAFT_46455 [Hyaloscypha bicolor E]
MGAINPEFETGTFCGGDDDDDRNNHDLPTIEELLFTKLQEQSFITEDRGLDKTRFGVEEVALEEKGGAVDQSRSTQSDNLDDPIVLQRDDDSSTSEAEVNNNTLRAESVGVLGAGLFDSLEIAVDSTPAPPPSSDGWHDINNPPGQLYVCRLRNIELRRQTPYILIPLLRPSQASHCTIALV